MLRIKNVSKNFKLKNINLNLEEGFIMGIIGPNGSGKTTLITKIADNFLQQNLKVLIIKHDPADKAQFDFNSKDSFKFFQI